ncbi:APC family permease [Micromonospora sp. NPDC048935]|uniref:APC family permease n=1 Tax=Micromonospora sp. NPDC048935 TaxID=3364262 RepID=UPI003717032F
MITAPRSPARVSNVANTLARNKLGVPSVVFFVMSAAAPLTVLAGGSTAGWAITGQISMPIAYIFVAVILAIFAVGFVAMSRHVLGAGGFYAYIAQGLGRPAGTGAAFIALMAYNAMQVGLYGGFAVVLAEFLDTHAGLNVHWLPCALVGWLLVSILGQLRVDLNGRVLAVLLVAECAVAALFGAVMIGHPADWAAGIGATMVTAVTGYVGFESTVVFSEETRDPRRTVARATFIAVGIIGLLYGGVAWAMSVATGPEHIVERATSDGTQLIFNLASPYVGNTIITLGELLFITSLFAALLAFHNTVARYAFALGRERVLPAAFGRTSRRNSAPWAGSLAQSILALAVLVGYAVAGADPYVHLFFWATVIGGLGVLILMVLTSATVVTYFTRDARGESPYRVFAAPALATIVLGWVLYTTIKEFDILLGVAPTDPLRWWIPAAYLITAALGVVWALALRRFSPDAYASIGRGSNLAQPSATSRPAPAHAGGRA